MATQTFRDWATAQKGYKVGNVGSTPTVNNVKLNPLAAGLKNINGSWTGTQDQYKSMVSGINPLTKLRDYFNEADIGYRGSTPSINGQMIEPEKAGLQNIDGNWYGTTAQLAQIQKELEPLTKVEQPSQSIADNPYQTQYGNELKELTKQLLTGDKFSYDPNKDTSLQAAQNETMEAVKRAAAKSNMLYSDDTARRMTEEAGKLAPQYEQLARDRFESDRNNRYNQLSAIQALEEQNRQQYQQGFENTLAESSLTGKYYGGDTLAGRDVALSEKAQEWTQKFNNKQFNYQEERDKIADNQFDKQFALQLDQFAWDKNANNPAVRNQILNNRLLEVELDYLPQTKQLEVAQIVQDLQSGKITQEMAKKQLDSYDLEIEQIKANIEGTKANTAGTKAATERTKIENETLNNASSGTSLEPYKDAEYKRYNDRIKEQGLVTGKTPTSSEKNAIANYLVGLANGGIRLDLIMDLAAAYNISNSQIEKALG
jgi:hypothetical protein